MGQIQHLFFQITQRVSLRYCQRLFLLVDQVSGPKDRLFKRYIQEYLPRVPCSFNNHGGNHSFIFSFLNSHWSLHFCHVVLFLRFFVNKSQNKYFNTLQNLSQSRLTCSERLRQSSFYITLSWKQALIMTLQLWKLMKWFGKMKI